MAVPEIHCDVFTETTPSAVYQKCTISKVPEYLLNDPDCEQNWSIVEGNTTKVIAMYPENELDSCAYSVTCDSVVTKGLYNLTWGMNCGRYQGDYSASYVVPSGADGGDGQSDTSQTPVSVIMMCIFIPLVILVLVAVLSLYLKCKKPQKTEEYRRAVVAATPQAPPFPQDAGL